MIEKITYNDRKERRVSIPSTQIIEEKARKRLKDIILARNRFAIMMALTDEENRVQIKISNE
jgi:DNA-binding TFAR19-related protein (PDSD5 family)